MANDSSKVKTLVFLASEYRRQGDSLTLSYARAAYDLAETLGFIKGKADAATQLGRYMQQIEKLSEALKYYHESVELYGQSDKLSGIATGYLHMGTVYDEQGKYELARESYEKSRALYERDNRKEGVARAIGNIGMTYDAEGKYAKALEAHLQALKINEEIGNKQGMAHDFSAIAICYGRQENPEKAIEFNKKALDLGSMEEPGFVAHVLGNLGFEYIKINEYAQAMDVLNKALLIHQKMSSAGQIHALTHIAGVYLKQNDLSAAATYYRRALALWEIFPAHDPDLLAGSLSDLSGTYVKMGKADSALFFAKQGLDIVTRIKFIPSEIHVNEALYEAYKLKGDRGNALHYLERYMANKDSSFNKEKNTQFRELMVKYETEKKEQEITILNNEKALQESKFNNRVLLLSLSVAVTLAVITFLFITIRSNRRRQESERLLLNEQLRNKELEAGKLHEMDELKSRFFANIAHEFRTPLTLIAGPVENLLEDNKDKYAREQLLLVKNNSGRLLGLINQLLDLSKLESGVTKLELHKGDVMTFIKGITFSFQSLADEREISLECDAVPAELMMDFDRDKLEKVMSNLLSNAFKFTPDLGFIKVSARQTLVNGTANLEISVADSGIGIPEDQIDFIFNRFYQADNAPVRNSQGSGIGLALTRELVELHGGIIKVSSNTSGTVFSVSLPVGDDITVKSLPVSEHTIADIQRETFRENGNENAQEIIHTENNAPEIVLVIEDNAEVRNFIIGSLNGYYKVISAADGDEGIAMAFDHVPDLIVSDVMMPGKSGFDVSRILKKDERTSHIPIILLTAKAGFENKMEGLETGADDFIPKPFSTRELLTRIRNLITIRKKLREKYLNYALSDSSESETIEDSFLMKLREAIEARLDDTEFSVEDLCREVGMSRTHLHRKLKALTNQSASQFIRILKLQHGQRLLRQGKYNVSEVADKVGFASLAYFSSSYASHFGYAPSEEKLK